MGSSGEHHHDDGDDADADMGVLETTTDSSPSGYFSLLLLSPLRRR